MKHHYLPEGMRIVTPENEEYLTSRNGLERAIERNVTLEAVALLCDSDFRLHFRIGGIPAIMTREEAAYTPDGEPVKDIAILTRVGKPVCFKILGFERDVLGREVALLSRRAAQEECRLFYIDELSVGDIIPAVITHLECFGAFVDIGCGIVSLLSIDCISVSRISHPKFRLSPGERITVVVKSVDRTGRIFVSQRELLGTWEENAALFTPGQTVAGIIRSIESYGVFVELTPNLAGLAEPKEGVLINKSAAVFIKSIIPEKMKIKLIIIDTAGTEPEKATVRYFTDIDKTSHIRHWRYSPDCCPRVIESCFL
jgi:small subunit ribosomal protein S1